MSFRRLRVERLNEIRSRSQRARTNSAWLPPNTMARTTRRLRNGLQLSETAHRVRQNRPGPAQPASDNAWVRIEVVIRDFG
jgi:hypothetical protein